jgi:hypothetical protein
MSESVVVETTEDKRYIQGRSLHANLSLGGNFLLVLWLGMDVLGQTPQVHLKLAS